MRHLNTSSGSRSPKFRPSGGNWADTRRITRCCKIRALSTASRLPGLPAEAMGGVKDFWQEPAYAELLLAMQKRIHDYVVADQGTAQEALDLLIEDWTEVFEDEGKL